jgi:hypothetical protein
VLANICNHLISATTGSLDPTQINMSSYNDDETTMVIASNCTSKKPRPKLLNALTIANHQAMADMGATSIFIMKGVAVDNKHIAISPLTIDLPGGKRSNPHMCVI